MHAPSVQVLHALRGASLQVPHGETRTYRARSHRGANLASQPPAQRRVQALQPAATKAMPGIPGWGEPFRAQHAPAFQDCGAHPEALPRLPQHRLLRAHNRRRAQIRRRAGGAGACRLRRAHHRRGVRGRPGPRFHGQRVYARRHRGTVPQTRRGGHALRILLPGRHIGQGTWPGRGAGKRRGVQPDASLAHRREHAHRLSQLAPLQ